MPCLSDFKIDKKFFLEIVPAYPGQTITHIFNQSLIAAILRILTFIANGCN